MESLRFLFMSIYYQTLFVDWSLWENGFVDRSFWESGLLFAPVNGFYVKFADRKINGARKASSTKLIQ